MQKADWVRISLLPPGEQLQQKGCAQTNGRQQPYWRGPIYFPEAGIVRKRSRPKLLTAGTSALWVISIVYFLKIVRRRFGNFNPCVRDIIHLTLIILFFIPCLALVRPLWV